MKMFDRTANLTGSQIINYRASPDEKWLVLVGIAPGAPEVSVRVWRHRLGLTRPGIRAGAAHKHGAAASSRRCALPACGYVSARRTRRDPCAATRESCQVLSSDKPTLTHIAHLWVCVRASRSAPRS
jgi:hypothetical protein